MTTRRDVAKKSDPPPVKYLWFQDFTCKILILNNFTRNVHLVHP